MAAISAKKLIGDLRSKGLTRKEIRTATGISERHQRRIENQNFKPGRKVKERTKLYAPIRRKETKEAILNEAIRRRSGLPRFFERRTTKKFFPRALRCFWRYAKGVFVPLEQFDPYQYRGWLSWHLDRLSKREILDFGIRIAYDGLFQVGMQTQVHSDTFFAGDSPDDVIASFQSKLTDLQRFFTANRSSLDIENAFVISAEITIQRPSDKPCEKR